MSGHKDDIELNEEEMGKLTKKVKELIKNYLQLDNVNFLFGTGSSIHLGAASIQNIPSETEKYILNLEDEGLKNDFKSYVKRLQDNMMKKYNPVKDEKFFASEASQTPSARIKLRVISIIRFFGTWLYSCMVIFSGHTVTKIRFSRFFSG